MRSLNCLFFCIIILLALAGSAFANQAPADNEKILQAVGRAVDARISGWTWSADGRNWEPYQPRQELSQSVLKLKAQLNLPAVFAGNLTAGRPLILKLDLYGRGKIRINAFLAGIPVAQTGIEAGEGNARGLNKDLPLPTGASGELLLEVENRGFLPARGNFWPERRRPLAEEGLVFVLRKAELAVTGLEAARAELQRWHDSFLAAQRLINPELVRYTFTGRPYNIPDKRRIAPTQLKRLQADLQKAMAALDLKALEKGDWPALQKSIAKSYALAGTVKKYVAGFQFWLIGNAHIDIAWLWRMRETMEVAHNTYETVIRNMEEYPELVYAQSQAVTYEWIENQYPELFEQVKRKVKEGRWEIVGGMWVEPDCNLISGESWVRQILFGKNYFREKFGVDVRLGCNPDSFGYNWNMPQLYKKSGIDAFITQKISWNETTVFPYFFFWWQAPDGSRVLSYFPPLGYASRLNLNDVLTGVGKYEATTGRRKALILYGLGDHGGGPNREILDRVRGYQKLPIAPQWIHKLPTPFLNDMRRQGLGDLPFWNDELYLEYHQGTFTSQAATKKNNRQSESMASTAEKLASLGMTLGKDYPAKMLDEAWKIILTHQFHDILPGSSINQVYRDAQESYSQVRRKLGMVTRASLETLAAAVDSSKIPGRLLLVFNPLSWTRNDVVQTRMRAAAKPSWKLLDDLGREVPMEMKWEEETREAEVVFVAGEVPALGYRVYSLVEGAAEGEAVKATDSTMENASFRLAVNPKTGNIASLFDKRLGREFVRSGQEANRLWIYEDRPEDWDAWNIGYTGRGWEINQADSVRLLSSSPVRSVIQVKKSFLGLTKEREYPTENFPSSFFTQNIVLYRGLDRIDIQMDADWWEDHLSLKAVFPWVVAAPKAVYEIPFAAIERGTSRKTLTEKAKYEVPALRWADISDAQGGVSLLNDCKYGYDIDESAMKLSLLRSPTWPDPMADRGKHTFTYSIYTHAGSWHDGDTVRRGAELNQPLVVIPLEKHAGKLPPVYSFLSLSGRGVVLDTVKKERNGNGLILRLYESRGQPEKVILECFRPIKEAAETDLLEEQPKSLPLSGKSLPLEFNKFEIKTIKIKLDQADY